MRTKIISALLLVNLAFQSHTSNPQNKRRINESSFYVLSGLSIVDEVFTATNNAPAFSER